MFVGRKSMVDYLSVEMLEEGLHVSKVVLFFTTVLECSGPVSYSTYPNHPILL